MDRIIFEVDDVAAKKWRYASKEEKDHINYTVNRILKKAFEKTDDFWEFLERVGKKAEENGITEEQLDKLLNEE